IFQADRHRADHALANVVAFKLLMAVFIDGFEKAFAKCTEMGPAIAGVLTVDEGVKRFTKAAVAVGEAELEHFLRVMQRGINGFAPVGLQVLQNQIEQTVAGLERFPVIMKLEPAVEIAVMTQPALDVFRAKLYFFEDLGIRLKLY